MQYNFKPYDRVLVRSGADGVWCADMFSHATKEMVWLCSHSCYSPSCVIPYEGNEHLLGTTDDPEPDFKFGDKVMVKDDNTNWIKANFIIYDPDDSGYNYKVYTYKGIVSFQHCRKGWDGDTDSSTSESEFKFGDKVAVRNDDTLPWEKGVYIEYNDNRTDGLYHRVISSKWDYDISAYRYCRHADW